MSSVTNLIDRIRFLPGARIDHNFLQGIDKVATQLQSRTPHSEFSDSGAEQFVQASKERLNELENWVSPYELPYEYLFFLGYYGGLQIMRDHYYFTIYGLGPMVEDWYAYVMGDTAFFEPSENGFLIIGWLSFDVDDEAEHHVTFAMDLAGKVNRHSVIAIPSWTCQDVDLNEIVSEPLIHSLCWVQIATSFTEWLQLIVNTSGTFGYFQS